MVRPLFRKMPSDWWLRARLHLRKFSGHSARADLRKSQSHHDQNLLKIEMISRS
jgi:hypothetical protein